jgi:hypothetical protein
VVTIVNAWVKEVKPDAFHFHTDNEKLSRLYKRLVKVWEKLGYSSRVTDNAGRNTSIFRFARKPTREVAASDDHYDDLTEAFDKPYKFKVVSGVNKVEAIADIPSVYGPGKDIEFKWGAYNKPTGVDYGKGMVRQDNWEVVLWIDRETENYERAADPARVMATVFAATKRFIKEVDPRSFRVFDRSGKKTKLWRVFTKMMGRLGYDGEERWKTGGWFRQTFSKRGAPELPKVVGFNPLHPPTIAASDDHQDTLDEAFDKPYPYKQPARWEESIEESVGGRVVFPRWAFDVEVVASEEDIVKGLMHRDGLPANTGMLFVFPNRQEQAMYMKNTSMPLDFVFIDSGKVVHIVQGSTPFSQDLIPSTTPVTHVLEINAGGVKQHGIEVGDPVRLEQ